MQLADSHQLLVGQKVLAIGNPFGLDSTLTTGVISALGREIESMAGTRIEDTLQDIAITMGAREAAICRELTKLHEEIRRATVSELAKDAGELETRGEFVVVIAPPEKNEGAVSDDALDDMLRDALKTESVKDAVAQVMDVSGRPRREIYARALALTKSAEIDDDA